MVIFGRFHSTVADWLNRYNWAARKLHKRLVQLGAVETYSRGEADEQHDEGLILQLLNGKEYLLMLNEGLMPASFLGLMTSAFTF